MMPPRALSSHFSFGGDAESAAPDVYFAGVLGCVKGPLRRFAPLTRPAHSKLELLPERAQDSSRWRGQKLD